MPPTIRDVAKKAGVSFALVSKYLNRHPQARLSEATGKRIDEAVRELGYQISLTARSLKTGRTRTLGLLIGNLTNEFYAHFADCAFRCAGELGYQLLLGLYNRPEERQTALNHLLARQVDAVFTPDAAVCRDNSGFQTLNLTPDIRKACDNAMKMLRRNGCQHVAGVFFANSGSEAGLFEEAARVNGLHPEAVHADFDETVRRDQLRELCGKKPSAVYSNGWQTTVILTELLDREFKGYHPKLILKANCGGAFLKHPDIAGGIYLPQKQLIREMIRGIVAEIEEKTAGRRPVFKAEFLTGRQLRLRGWSDGRFTLT